MTKADGQVFDWSLAQRLRQLSAAAAGAGDLAALRALANGDDDIAALARRLVSHSQEIDQRVKEIAIFNSVGEAMAKTLNVKTVTRIVGDKVREIFSVEVVEILLKDRESGLITVPYAFSGTYREPEPFAMGEGLTSKVILTGQPLMLRSTDDQVALGALIPTEDDRTESYLGVPIIAGDEVLGVVSVQSYQQDAFNETHVRLLQGLSTSMSVAIANARLFDETQRLLKETERRAAELGAVGKVSQALIAEADFDGTIQLIGNQMRDIFNADIVYVALLDPDSRLIHFPYQYGESFTTLTLGEGLTSKIIETGEPLLINQDLDERSAQIGATRVGKDALSYLGVPIKTTRGTMGVISVQSTTREGMFNDDSVRLLSTIAANAGAALHNAQLYTETLQLSRSQQQAKEAAEAANRGQERLPRHHEPRNPHADERHHRHDRTCCSTPSSTPSSANSAGRSTSSAEALLTIINDILDFSKIEAGKLDLDLRPFDLRECLESAIDLVAPQAQPKRDSISAMLSSRACPTVIVGDPDRLRQVLLNLLDNAVKFTEAGEVVLSVSRAAGGEGADVKVTLQFAIRDTGIGIPKDRMDRLFKSFSQVDASTTRRYGGTGLGLAISKRLVELMGGEVRVASTEGEGTTFLFTLSTPPAPAVAEASPPERQLSGKRLLVVDDNATNQRIVSQHAEAWGMLAQASGSAADALARLARGEVFDAIVLDMDLPGTDGIELARQIQAGGNVPLLLLRSMVALSEHRKRELESAEFAVMLTKPIKASPLLDALMAILAGAPLRIDRPEQANGVALAETASNYPLRILVVDDNATNRKLASKVLERLGYKTDLALDGRSAVARHGEGAHDVIFMDIEMPDMDGVEATRLIRAAVAGAGPYVVALTANAMSGDRERYLQAGFDDYVSKPLHVEELVASLKRAFKVTSSA